jgi:hypothetical protein
MNLKILNPKLNEGLGFSEIPSLELEDRLIDKKECKLGFDQPNRAKISPIN